MITLFVKQGGPIHCAGCDAALATVKRTGMACEILTVDAENDLDKREALAGLAFWQLWGDDNDILVDLPILAISDGRGRQSLWNGQNAVEKVASMEKTSPD